MIGKPPLAWNLRGALFLLVVIPSSGLAQERESIPRDFRGKLTYEGFAEGTMSTPGRAPRSLTLDSVLKSATSGKTQQVQASIRYDLEYNGQSVIGTYQYQGQLRGSGRITGTRMGSTCNLVHNSGIRISAYCNANRFTSNASYSDERGKRYQVYFEANRTALVDYVERDQQRLVAAEKTRVDAMAAAARYEALPNASPALIRKLDGFVQVNSRGWMYNQYVAGSMRDVKIVEGTAASGTYVMRGNYTFNGGQQGWVMAKMVGGKLGCIEFWDAVVGCRGLRDPVQTATTGNTSTNSDYDRQREAQQLEERRNDYAESVRAAQQSYDKYGM